MGAKVAFGWHLHMSQETYRENQEHGMKDYAPGEQEGASWGGPVYLDAREPFLSVRGCNERGHHALTLGQKGETP